jgi:hypothetical protein
LEIAGNLASLLAFFAIALGSAVMISERRR